MLGIIRGYRDTIMKLGILFPVAIFIVAVVFLGWFLSAAMRRRAGHNEKAPLLCWLSPSWRWPAPSSAGGDRRGDIAELSYPINKLTLYTHVIRRGILGPGKVK